MTTTRTWHVVTGEYPPDPGGVSDYTRLVAGGLVERGDAVHVWAPGADAGPVTEPPGVVVHRVGGRFTPLDLPRLDRELNRTPGPRRLLVQYTGHFFGLKAMNLPVCLWFLSRRLRHGDDVRVMFHEVAFPFVRRPLKHNAIAVAHRGMAAVLLAAASRVYVSIPAWVPLLAGYGGRRVPTTWLPVPSNVPPDPPASVVAAARARVREEADGADIVGHFGTYGDHVVGPLRATLGRLLADRPRLRVVLIGRGSEAFAAAMNDGRVTATGGLPPDRIAAHLRACDVAVQPYPDGVSTRRGSMMAALANGVPVVTNLGPLTEPVWAAGDITPVVPTADPAALAAAVARLLDDPAGRAAAGRRGREYYDRHFALARTLTALRADA